MPELPEVEAVRRRLVPAMVGEHFERVTLRRPDLRQPFPARFASRLRGVGVRTLERRGKYLLAGLSSNETLLMHLGMSGSFRVDDGAAAAVRERADVHDHVVFLMSSGRVVTFNDPRRFGLMDLVPTLALGDYPALRAMGPEPLSRAFDGAALARACAGRRVPLKVALLDQRVVAGLGNIYASEALYLARLSPRLPAAAIATPTGAPREAANRLAAAIKRVLREAVARQTGAAYRDSWFRVYDREGEPCLTRACPGVVRRFEQAGRSTFSCSVCQRDKGYRARRS